MEDTHGDGAKAIPWQATTTVLILIIMEDTHGVNTIINDNIKIIMS